MFLIWLLPLRQKTGKLFIWCSVTCVNENSYGFIAKCSLWEKGFSKCVSYDSSYYAMESSSPIDINLPVHFFNVLQHHCRCCGRTLCAEHSSSQMACLLSLYMHLNWVTRCNNFWPILFLLRAIFRPYHNLVFIHSSEFALIVLMMPLGNFLSLWIIMVFFLGKF